MVAVAGTAASVDVTGAVAPGPPPPVAPAPAPELTAPPVSTGYVPPTAAAPPLDGLHVPSAFPLSAIGSIASPSAAGQVFRLDGGFLDALRLQVRRIKTAEGQPGYELEFKIAGPSREDFAARLEQQKATHQPFTFFASTVEKAGDATLLVRNGQAHPLSPSFSTHVAPGTSGSANQALRLSEGAATIEMIPNSGPAALRGQVRIQLIGDDATASAALKSLVDKLGLQIALSPPTAGSLRRYALMRLLQHLAPAKAKALASEGILNDLKVATIEAALAEVGVSPERMNKLRYLEVAPGHFTVCDDQLVTDVKEKGLRFAYSTVQSEEHVLSILQNGQASTLKRWSEGALVNGMSSMADVGSGGAQGVFSRLVTTSAQGKSWTGRRFKIILKPQLLGRLDIWGWPGDYYGRSWDLSDRNFGAKLVEDAEKNGYQAYNEIISPVGNGPQYIAAVVATTEPDRQALVQYLQNAGYQPPHGKTFDQFVRLAPTIDTALLG